VLGGITKILITWETNETKIYLLVQAKCVRCNLVQVQAKQSSLNTLMGDRVEGLACADPGARTPIGVSGNFKTKQAGHGHN
jgi:hypothetical protein